MKYLFLIFVLLLLIGGCAVEVGEEKEMDVVSLKDEPVLQEYPDGLDDAFQELDELES